MRLLAALATCVALSGCVSVASNDHGLTATDQILPTHALREATRAIDLRRVPAGSKIFIDTPGLTGADAAMVIAAIQARRMQVVDKPAADYLVTVACPVLGTDTLTRVLGFPGGAVPVSASGGLSTVTIPEVSLWSSTERTGVAELEVTVVDARTHRLVSAQGPVFGVARIKADHVLTGLIFGDELAPPRVLAARR